MPRLILGKPGRGALAALSLLHHGCPSSPPDGGASAPAPPPSPTAIAEVSAGAYFTCARIEDGTVRCWGWNRDGQLGDGTRTNRAVPQPVAGLADVTQIAAGQRHACALRKDGAVLCWGDDVGGALGRDGDDAREPVEVPLAHDVTRLALGWSLTCAAHARDVGCWGEYVDNGNSTSRELTFAMPARPDALVAGGERACAIVAGQGLCWGKNEDLALVPGRGRRLSAPAPAPAFSRVISIAMSMSHACAVGDDYRVRCLGDNGAGQLGDGTKSARATPAEVKGIGDAIAVVALDAASCALRQGGTVACWGGNQHGELGDGSAAAESLVPVPVEGLGDVASLTGRGDHACALRRDHRLFCWGSNERDELGQPSLRGSAVPLDVAGIVGATAIAAGGSRTCARLDDGAVWCFGAPSDESVSGAPSRVEGLTGVADLAIDDSAVCGRTADAHVACTGERSFGQLPEGPPGPWGQPRRLDQELGDVAGLALGSSHGCARLERGTVSCWGMNEWGQRGGRALSRSGDRPAPPTRVAGLGDVRSLAVGPTESCALDAGGKVRCWGAPTQSSYGIDAHPDEPVAIRMQPVTLALGRVTAIAHGRRHGCALLDDGTVACWGRDDYGQLGDGRAGAPREAPAPVRGLTGVVEIALGSFFGCARTGDGKVSCWGDNFEGQLGDGTRVDRAVPVPVRELDGALGLALGHTHACARIAGGRLKCWGTNLHRELGQGAPAAARTPVEVKL